VRYEQRALPREAEQRAASVVAQLERMRPAAFEHSRRVAALATRVARQAKLPAEAVTLVYWGAMVHDIGELNVRRTVLDKVAPLDDQERAQIYEHTTIGSRWLSSVPGLAPLVPFARWHHERFDGKGYRMAARPSACPSPCRSSRCATHGTRSRRYARTARR
jgi:putative nucleotidyltransferase with HDIG domain